MIGVPEARFHVAAVRQLAAAGLTEYTDKELICRVISEEARKMDIRVIESDIFGDIPCTHPFYQSLGAADLLRERHGQEYVDRKSVV